MNMLTRAERIYATLLHLYPKAFRREFGEQMQLCFRDAWRAAQDEPPIARLALLIDTGVDLTVIVSKQYFQEIQHMNEITRARLFALATMMSGIAWIILWVILNGDDTFASRASKTASFVLIYPTIALALVGLARLIPRSLSSRIAVAAGLIMLALSLVGVMLENWILFSLPLSLFFIAHAIVSIGILRHKPFAYLNGLSLITFGLFISMYIANPYNYTEALAQAWGTSLVQYTSTFILIEMIQSSLFVLIGLAWFVVGILMARISKQAKAINI